MASMRTSTRDVSRPIAVTKQHSRRKQRTRRHESHQKSSPSSHTVAVSSVPTHDPVSYRNDESLLVLNFMQQPDERIAIGRPVKVDVMVSLRYSHRRPSIDPMHLDHSGLITFATLLAEDQDGEFYPVDASILQTQKKFDSVHSFKQPEKQCAVSWYQLPDRLPLGYCSFPELRIAHPGTFRIRITLMKTGGSAEEGATNVTSIDSMPITVCQPLTRRR